MVRDAIVVGNGIVGATISAALRLQGLDVLTLDDVRPGAGTPPSGGHLKPSWFGGMKKTEYEPAMELLDKVWGLKTEEFKVWPTPARVTVYRVDTDQVLQSPKTIATVKALAQLQGFPKVITSVGEYQTRLLVLATGVWAHQLLPAIQTVAKKGVSFRVTGVLKSPFIRPWAPYKQIVAHQQTEDQIWVGDGSALLEKSWTDQRTQQCMQRCIGALKQEPPTVTQTLTGLRPYLNSGDDPCYLERLYPKVWVATGAGKSGTIAAGWAAWRITSALS